MQIVEDGDHKIVMNGGGSRSIGFCVKLVKGLVEHIQITILKHSHLKKSSKIRKLTCGAVVCAIPRQNSRFFLNKPQEKLLFRRTAGPPHLKFGKGAMCLGGGQNIWGGGGGGTIRVRGQTFQCKQVEGGGGKILCTDI